MAERRSLHKKISLSKQVNQMSVTAQLLFTWSIPHADDLGFLPRDASVLKATVFPMKERPSVGEVEKLIQEIMEQDLYKEVTYEQKPFLKIERFYAHQDLRRDRQPKTILPVDLSGRPQESWEKLDEIVDNLVTVTDNQWSSEGKGSEEKGLAPSEAKAQPVTVSDTTPAEYARDFFNRGDAFEELRSIAVQYMDPQVADKELEKFIEYWTEPNKSGTKVRWEQQSTFDVRRRLKSWFNKVGQSTGSMQGGNKYKAESV